MAKAKAKKNHKKRLVVIAALIAAVFMTPLAAGAVSTVFPALAGRTAEPEQDKQQKPAEMAENIDNTDETPADDGKKDEDTSSENGYAAVQLLTNDLLRPNTLKALIEELEYIPFDTGDGTVYVPVRKNENGYPVCTLQESTDSAGQTVTWSVNIDENTDYKELLSDIDSDKYYMLAIVLNHDESFKGIDDEIHVMPNHTIQGSLHFTCGTVRTNEGLIDMADGMVDDPLEVEIDGYVVYVPLARDEDNNYIIELCEGEDCTPDTYIRTVEKIAADGTETGWAEVMKELPPDGHIYYLTWALDYTKAYILDDNGEKIPIKIVQ